MTKMTLLSDFTYTPSYTDEEFEKAEEFLSNLPMLSFGTSNYALIRGEDVFNEIGQACHAGLGRGCYYTGCSLIATEALFYSENRRRDYKPTMINDDGTTSRRDRKENVVDGFWQWFVHESLFGRFILNRDLPSVKRGWIISTDLPPAITQSLAIVGRHFFEVLDRAFITFDDLVSSGVPKSVAYVTAINCYYSYSYVPKKAGAVYTPLYQHRLFSFPSDLRTLQNFSEGLCQEKNLNTPSYRDTPSIRGSADLFGEGGEGSSRPFTYTLLARDKELKDFLQSLRGDTNSVPTVVNPFKRSLAGDTSDPFNVNNQEMFEIIKFMTSRGDFKNAVH